MALLEQGIGVRALVELVALGAACGPLGVWVLLYRQAYAAESLAHGMLPGLVIASLVGLPVAAGAAAGGLAAAVAVAGARRAPRTGPDAAVAVALTTLTGAGALAALAAAAPTRLEELLFGDPLGGAPADVAIALALAGVVACGLLAGHRPLALGAFDRESSGALGARPEAAELGLLLLLGATVVAAVQALGSLLVVALLVAPAAGALQVSATLRRALPLAAALAIAAGVAGLCASYVLDVAAGAAIALAAVAAFLVCAAAAGVSGRVRPRLRPSARS